MSNDISGIAANALSQLSSATGSGATKRAQQLAGSSDNQKIDRSAREFESILLASWLQSAEKSFATVPGGDPESENADPGRSQFQGYAMQAVATALTKAGGIGIASMIATQLRKTSAAEPAPASSSEDIGFSAVQNKR
jgi:Rod binding domain-containing protein